MKKRLLLFPLIAVLLYIILSSNSTGVGLTSGTDATGATGPAGCSCHGSTATTGITLSIELDSAGVAVSHYIAGNSYSIKITGTNTTSDSLPKFGFQLEAVKLSGAGTSTATNAGTLPTTGLPTSCQNTLVSSHDLVENSAAIIATSGTGTSGTVYSESIPWTAPAAGTGSVKLFAALNAVNGNGNDLGDFWNNSSATITEMAGVISGSSTVCAGSTITLSYSSSGGTWSSSNTAIATINSSSGIVTGVAQGTVTMTYTIGTISATASITVLVPPGPIGGNVTMCYVGTTITLTDSATGGGWRGGTPGIATINSTTGVVTSGLIAGNTTVTYSTGCGTDAYATLTVNPPSDPIAGNTPMCVGGSTITLSDSTGGGAWSGGTFSGGTSSICSVDYSTGIVTPGSTAGTAVITYSSVCGTEVFATVSVNAAPSSIDGNSPMCAGGSAINLTDISYGGIWSGGTTGIATVDSSTGAVTPGSTVGTAIITFSNGCGTTTTIVTVSPLPYVSAISDSTTVCQGANITLTDSTAGGTWSSSLPSFASVGSTTGIVHGVLSGPVTITYTVTNTCGATVVTQDIYVNPLPSPGTISGSSGICVGTTTTFTDVILGGVWSFNTPSIATVDSFTGAVTTLAAGIGTITYSVTNGCGTTHTTSVISINTVASAGTITGDSNACAGSVITLSDGVTGGHWGSSNTSVATIDSVTGVLSGIMAGSVTASYYITSTCGTATATHVVTVNPLSVAGVITGPPVVCQGVSVTLSDASADGIWSSSNIARVTIDSAMGVATGIATGTVTLTYSVTNICGTNYTTSLISVNPAPVAGIILGSTVVCLGTPVTYTETATGGVWRSSNPTTLAIDSMTGIGSGVVTGPDTIIYSVTNSCGNAVSPKYISVSTLPDAGAIIGPLSVCVGSDIILSESVAGGSWNTYNSNASVISGDVTGAAVGTDTIYYSVTNSCGTTTESEQITINPLPDPGTITGIFTVCPGATTTLTDGSAGGSWSAANLNADVSTGGVVVGVLSGTDNITYSVTNGCGTLTTNVVITINPLPVAGIITSMSGSFNACVGATDTLLETTTGGTWSAGNGNATISSGGIIMGVSVGTDTISYTVTTVCGSTYISKIITVNPLPFAGTITGVSILCADWPDTLHDATPGGRWTSLNTALAGVDSIRGIVAGISAGNDSIGYSVTNICGTATAWAAITVLTLPNPGIISGADSFCVSTSITLSESVAGGSWSSENTSIASVSGSVVTGLITGTDLVKYAVTNMCGTTDTTKQIFVKPMPNPSTIICPPSICTGTDTVLTESVPGGTWSVSNNINAVVAGDTVKAMAAGRDTIRYSVTNSCGTSTTTFSIAVDTFVTLAITGRSIICNGGTNDKDTLLGNPAGGNWNSSVPFDSINAAGVFYGRVVGTVKITYLYTNSCGTAYDSINILVLPVPVTGSINGSSFTVCNGSAITLTDTSHGGIWSAQNSNISIIATSDTVSVTGDSVGMDIVTYTVAGICGPISSNKEVTINPTPVPNIIIAEDSVTLSTTTTYSAYQWFRGTTLIPGATNSTYVLTDTGSYRVEVTNTYGCAAISAIFRAYRLAIPFITSASDFSIYPNPTRSFVFIKAHQNVDAQLTSIDGRVIMTTRNATQMDVSTLSNGIYFINIFDPVTGTKIYTDKILKGGD